jgi:hypothetical protein
MLPQLIFSLRRYEEVIEAYLAGLEEAAETLSPNAIHAISSVASFFIRYPPIAIVILFHVPPSNRSLDTYRIGRT